MMRLVKEEGTTLVLSTHDMGSVEALCDEVILLHQRPKGPLGTHRCRS